MRQHCRPRRFRGQPSSPTHLSVERGKRRHQNKQWRRCQHTSAKLADFVDKRVNGKQAIHCSNGCSPECLCASKHKGIIRLGWLAAECRGNPIATKPRHSVRVYTHHARLLHCPAQSRAAVLVATSQQNKAGQKKKLVKVKPWREFPNIQGRFQPLRAEPGNFSMLG